MSTDALLQAYENSLRRHDLAAALKASARILALERTAAYLARHATLHRLLNDFPACGKVIDELAKIDEPSARAERAEWLFERGLYDRALEETVSLQKLDPQHVTAFRVRAKVLRERGRIDDALAVVDAALAIHPNDMPLHAEQVALLGHPDNAKQDEETAWAALKKVLAEDPFQEAALVALARKKRRDAEVIALFDSFLKIAPNDFLVNGYYASFWANVAGDHGKALKHAEAALQNNIRAPWAWLKKMDALERLGRHNELHDAARDAVSAVPLSARLQRNLLAELRETGELSEAEALLAEMEKEEPGNADLVVARLDLLRRRGRVREALVLAADAEKLQGSERLTRMIATTYFETRQYPNARRVLEAARPTVGVWNDRILCEISEGSYEHAFEVAEEAEAQFPKATAILGLKAWLLAHRGKFADAHELLARLRVEDPGSDYPDIIEAEVHLMQSKFREARDAAEAMLKRHPERLDLRHMLCEVALHEERFSDAIVGSDEMLRRDASRTTAIQVKAFALAQSNRMDDAISLLDDSIGRFSYSAGLRACRGHLRLQDDDAHGAREDFHWATDASPAAVVAKTGLGTIAYRARRLGDARYWFKRAIDVHPGSVDALANLAWSYAVGSTPVELNAAEKYSEDAHRLVRNDARVLGVMAVVAFKRGERRKAIRLMERASKATPSELDLAVNLAMMQRIAGKLADAEATVGEVLKKDPQHTRARVEHAAVLLKSRKNEDARTMAESVVNENPSGGAGWRILAASHAAAGDATGAESVLRRAMAESDESELADVRVDLARILLTTSTPDNSDARLREARLHLTAALATVEDHQDALLLRAWSDLKLQRPSMALRSLDRIHGDQARGYVLSLRQAALQQRTSIDDGTGGKLQWFLASLITFQLALVWGLRFSDATFGKGAQFGTLVTLLCGLLLLTILLPRLSTFKLVNVVEAELSNPPAAASVDAILTPLTEFEMQPALAPVIGPLSYDT